MLARTAARSLALAAVALPLAAQESAALFDAPVVVAGWQHRFGVVADLDADGWADATSWWWVDETAQALRVYSWRNDRTGRLQAIQSTETVAITQPEPSLDNDVRVELTDLGGDDLPDYHLRVNGDGGGELHVFETQGITVEEVPAYGHASTAQIGGAVFADFDGDGLVDRALALGPRVVVWRYVDTGNGPEAGPSTLAVLGAPIDHLEAFDADGDGGLDLYANTGGVAHLVELIGGQVGSVSSYAHGIDTMPMPTAGDVDGDGDEDLVVFGMEEYVVLRRTGPASFEVEPSAAGGPATHLYDVDGDGDLDGLCCGGGGCGCCGPCPAFNRLRSIHRVTINDGSGSFAPAWEMAGLGSTRLAGAADLDHDGDLDLVAGRCVYYADGPIAAPMTTSIGALQWDTSVADLDRDGDPDCELGLTGVLWNAGDGSTASEARYLADAPPGTHFEGPGFPGDFDGDGDLDLLVRLRALSDDALVHMRLLVNTGGGALVDGGAAGPPGVDFNVSTNEHQNTHMAALVADADGDGDLDLFARTYEETPSASQLWSNDGAGVFAAGPWSSSNRTVFAAEDFDLDGLPDILVTGWGSLGVELWMGQGGGAFSLGTTYFGGSPLDVNPPLQRITVADVSGDGYPDVVAAEHSNFTTARVYVNDGTAQFPYPLSYELDYDLDNGSDTVAYSTLVDVDADGLDDWILAPARYTTNAAHIVRRRPDDTGWLPAVTQVLFVREDEDALLVPAGAIADVDGDGDPDLLTDRLVRNRRFDGPVGGLRRQLGAGAPAAEGTTPVLGAAGPFRVGEVAEVRLGSAPAATQGLLVAREVAAALPPFEGPGLAGATGVVTSRIAFVTDGEQGVPGSGSWSLSYLVPAYKAGRTYRYEALLVDPVTGAKSVRSNVLELTYGP